MADGTYIDGYYAGWTSILPEVPVPIRPEKPQGGFASYENGFYDGRDDALAWGRGTAAARQAD